MKNKLFLVFVFMLSLLTIVSCQGKEDIYYGVYFETFGGTEVFSQTVKQADLVSEVTSSKENYVLEGWYKEPTFRNKWYFFEDRVYEDTTLYAKWVSQSSTSSFTVIFISNGGADVNSQELVEGSLVVKPENPTKNSYIFAGWYKDSSLTNLWDFSNDVVSNNITLYAKWVSSDTILATYDYQGATSSQTVYNREMVVGESYTLVVPQKTGYTFIGWYSQAQGKGTKFTNSDGASLSNWATTTSITVYAYFQAITYKIKFNSNSGNAGGSMSELTLTYDTPKNLTSNGFQLFGNTFVSWNTNSDGTGISYTNQQSVKNLTTENNLVINLYAIWTPGTYVITYSYDGATSSNTEVSTNVTFGQPFVFVVPVKDNYIFLGWWSSSKQLTDETGVGLANWNLSGNQSVTAHYKTTSYKISFKGNGSTSGVMNDLTVGYDNSITLTQNNYTRTDYDFIGWNTSIDGSGISYANKEIVKNLTTEDLAVINLYAQWSPSYLNYLSFTLTQDGLGYRVTPKSSIVGNVIIPREYNGLNVIEIGTFGKGGSYQENNIGRLITSIFIPNTVTKIDDWAFAGLGSLTSVVFEEISQVEEITEWMFKDCYKLETISLPPSIKVIETEAFLNCTLLNSVTGTNLDGITRIYHDAFKGTKLINSAFRELIYVGNWVVGFGKEYSIKYGTDLIVGDNQLKPTTIGIADWAFITRPLSDNPLITTSWITSVTLPTSLKYIGEFAFSQSDTLQNSTINIPDEVISIGKYAFGSTKIGTINFGVNSKLEYIGDYAFQGANITSITIPSSVVTLSKGAFSNCNQLNVIIFEDGSLITVIDEFTFYETSLLDNINIPNGVVEIKDNAFEKSGIINIVIPKTVVSIGNNVFNENHRLVSITLNRLSTDGITTLGRDNIFVSLLHIYVYDVSSLDAYKNAENWNSYSLLFSIIS
jgi:uncharacterized repeat protein (TIGR02543 family)